MRDEDQRLEIIRALLAKAERTNHPEEAKTFTAKAEELMVKWAIDDALLHGATQEVGTIDLSEIWLPANEYRAPKVDLLNVVAINHDCKLILYNQRYVCPECKRVLYRGGLCPMHNGTAKRMFKVGVIGFLQDRGFTELLFTSLLIQAEREFESSLIQSAMARETPQDNRAGGHRIAWRNTFIQGYAARIGERLRAARRRATDEATETHGAGVAIVLADRSAMVQRRYNEMFPKTTTKRSSAGRSWGSGWGLGSEAANKADLGKPRVGGSRKELGA
jgi:hypothetical protein